MPLICRIISRAEERGLLEEELFKLVALFLWDHYLYIYIYMIVHSPKRGYIKYVELKIHDGRIGLLLNPLE